MNNTAMVNLNDDNNKALVKAVFRALMKLPYDELNSFLGSMTICDMAELYTALKHERYCVEHNLSSWREMTEDDYLSELREELRN